MKNIEKLIEILRAHAAYSASGAKVYVTLPCDRSNKVLIRVVKSSADLELAIRIMETIKTLSLRLDAESIKHGQNWLSLATDLKVPLVTQVRWYLEFSDDATIELGLPEVNKEPKFESGRHSGAITAFAGSVHTTKMPTPQAAEALGRCEAAFRHLGFTRFSDVASDEYEIVQADRKCCLMCDKPADMHDHTPHLGDDGYPFLRMLCDGRLICCRADG